MKIETTYSHPKNPPSSTYYDTRPVTISDEHPACSYGQPVAIVDGIAYGPAELPYPVASGNLEYESRMLARIWNTLIVQFKHRELEDDDFVPHEDI